MELSNFTGRAAELTKWEAKKRSLVGQESDNHDCEDEESDDDDDCDNRESGTVDGPVGGAAAGRGEIAAHVSLAGAA